MKLQLYLNGSLFNEQHLPYEMLLDQESNFNWRDRVIQRQEMLEGFKEDMKGRFWVQICKAKSWQIVFVAESKMNVEEEVEQTIYI